MLHTINILYYKILVHLKRATIPIAHTIYKYYYLTVLDKRSLAVWLRAFVVNLRCYKFSLTM